MRSLSLFLVLFLASNFASAQTPSYESMRLAQIIIQPSLDRLQKSLSQRDDREGTLSDEARNAFFDALGNSFAKGFAISLSERLLENEIKDSLDYFQSPAGQKYLATTAGLDDQPQSITLYFKESCISTQKRALSEKDRNALVEICRKI